MFHTVSQWRSLSKRSSKYVLCIPLNTFPFRSLHIQHLLTSSSLILCFINFQVTKERVGWTGKVCDVQCEAAVRSCLVPLSRLKEGLHLRVQFILSSSEFVRQNAPRPLSLQPFEFYWMWPSHVTWLRFICSWCVSISYIRSHVMWTVNNLMEINPWWDLTEDLQVWELSEWCQITCIYCIK